jgi:hypothetical protein
MAISLSEEKLLSEAFSIIEQTPDTQVVIDKLLRLGTKLGRLNFVWNKKE